MSKEDKKLKHNITIKKGSLKTVDSNTLKLRILNISFVLSLCNNNGTKITDDPLKKNFIDVDSPKEASTLINTNSQDSNKQKVGGENSIPLKIKPKKELPIEKKPFNEFINEHPKSLIAHCREGKKINLLNYSNSIPHSTILIGPEGDFTKEEIEMALVNQAQTISLGQQRFRTETAGIIACHTVAVNATLVKN